MEHFIRIAVWITLSGCLQTKSLPIRDFGAEYMRKEVKCKNDLKIYTPGYVKDQCITTALDCVRQELYGNVRPACEDSKERIDDALAFLDGLIQERLGKGPALIDSTECECERWSETSFSTFLNGTISFLQQIQTMLTKNMTNHRF